MTISARVMVITGANRGLGFELVRRLADKFRGASVYLTSRNESAGLDAVEKLSEQGLNACYHRLDVTKMGDIENLRDTLISKHGDPSVDILVNNAGVNFGSDKDRPIDKRIEETIMVNYFGCVDMCHTFFPLLRPGARVLNVASTMAKPIRKQLSSDVRHKMDSEDLTLAELNALMEDYVKYGKAGTHNEMGFCNHAYGISKYAVIALTRILAKERKAPGVLVNCCCPGWVRTDMGGPRASKSVESGVKTLLDCVLLPEGEEPNGKFIFEGKVFKLD